ncbi:MAG: BMP family ABC transporter substrate-binding protein [Candidatus Faecousia sp.]|nr:BMP family ABC transporter substrate-binding protein [Candidatus Faecousia sp.]
MNQVAVDEYDLALRAGQKEAKELTAAGKNPNPAVLDEILPEGTPDTAQEVGLLDIPAHRIVGVKSAGRITAFTASFKPLLDRNSEFAFKWISLCDAHLGDTGIRDPIECYEYLGNFYVQEGNKRVSVLRHFGAPRIPGNVRRIVPPMSDDPRIKAYYEFLDFFKGARLYEVQFRRPGDYGKLLTALGKQMGEPWSEEERRTFRAYFQYFRDAFAKQDLRGRDVLPEEALLLWLELYPYADLGRLSTGELRKSLSELWKDVVSSTSVSVKVETKTEGAPSGGLFTWITTPDHLNVAFVHQLSPGTSPWVMGHEEGRKHLEAAMGDKVTARSYFDANTPEAARQKIEEAVSDGAQVVFTTAPPLIRATLKAAVEHPKIAFFNCSVDKPYTSVKTYYGRIYEAKYISGAIAGAMALEGRIGYIASYPNYGVPASINAFALGAQLTNPRAQIELRWNCVAGTPQADLLAGGIRVVSNRDAPTQSKMYLDFCSYGTYLMDGRGDLVPLGSPVWLWGKFYEYIIRGILTGSWKNEKGAAALNYWLGMDSGVIDISLSDKLPEGVRQLASLLRRGLIEGTLDPFGRRIVSQDGSLRSDGTHRFSPEELLKMDWLCDNVLGSIPSYDEILPVSQPLVRELGLYSDKIPTEKEKKTREDTDRVR